jgi:hypothetical protein
VQMYIVYEDASCLLLALITSTLLCSTYVMFLLLSKGVRILAPYAVKTYTRRHSVKREMNRVTVSPDLVTGISGSLPTAACTSAGERT